MKAKLSLEKAIHQTRVPDVVMSHAVANKPRASDIGVGRLYGASYTSDRKSQHPYDPNDANDLWHMHIYGLVTQFQNINLIWFTHSECIYFPRQQLICVVIHIFAYDSVCESW